MRSQEARRQYRSSRERHRAYRAKGRKTVLKGKGEPEATVRGRGQRGNQEYKGYHKGKQRKGTEVKGEMLHIPRRPPSAIRETGPSVVIPVIPPRTRAPAVLLVLVVTQMR